MKNEEILKIEDLVDGEIYCFTRPIWNYYYIAFYNKEGYLRDEKDCYKYQNTIYNYYSDSKITKPNSKQKHWLNECIKANKFINYEEAMKTFKEEPENISLVGRYFEALVDDAQCSNIIKGEYYKIIKENKSYFSFKNNQGTFMELDKDKPKNYKIMPIGWSPDKEPKKEIDMKKVEDLVYPDVIHLESQKQLDKILKYNPRLYKSFKKYMLFGDKTMKTGYGADNESYSNISYNIYEFSDTIFPEESIKDYDYEVVHCETQEQWEFVIKKLNYFNTSTWSFKDYPYIILNEENSCNNKWIGLKNSKIYTFSEWCKLNNYVMEEENWIPKEKEWVVSLENKGDYRKKGDVFQVLKVINKGQDIYYQKYVNGSTKTFRKALPHEIPNNQSNQTIDIGDEVSTPDGNGIVIGISEYDNYLVKGINNSDVHNGHPYNIILKKGNFSNQKDSYYYLLSNITLVKKANSNIDINRELGIVLVDTGVPSTTNNTLQVKVRNKQIVPIETKQRVRVQLKSINKLNLTHYGN